MAGASTIGPAVPIQGQGDMTVTPGQTPEPLPAADDSLMSTATAPAAVRPRPRGDAPYAVVGRPRNEGHGKRLTAAFEALEVFPALAESRNRLLALIAEERPSTGDVVRAIESDVALVISVMRLANGLDSPAPRPGRVGRRLRRGALARGRPAPRGQRRDLRVLRARQDLGRRSRALPPARRRRPARRRPPRRGRRLRAPRPPARHRPAARRRQARAHARLPGLPEAGPRTRPHARGAPALRAPRARRRPRPGRRRPRPPLEPSRTPSRPRSSAITPTTPRATPPSCASPTCSRTTRRAPRSPRPSSCAPPAPSASARASCARCSTTCRTRRNDRPRAVEPCPLSIARAGRPQAPRPGHGLQADRARALALDQHGPHPPAQHLRQARRRRPRAGRPARHRARLALDQGGIRSAPLRRRNVAPPLRRRACQH